MGNTIKMRAIIPCWSSLYKLARNNSNEYDCIFVRPQFLHITDSLRLWMELLLLFWLMIRTEIPLNHSNIYLSYPSKNRIFRSTADPSWIFISMDKLRSAPLRRKSLLFSYAFGFRLMEPSLPSCSTLNKAVEKNQSFEGFLKLIWLQSWGPSPSL